MPTILRSIAFSCFSQFSRLLLKTGVLNTVLGAWRVDDFFFTKLWPYQEFTEVAGGKMYVSWSEPFVLRRTFQTYILMPRWEEQTTMVFRTVVKGGDVVLDLGANIGYFSLLAAKLVGDKGRVYSFEPEPRNFHLLQKNIELNGYRNVVPMQKAVSDKAGKAKLAIHEGDSGSHTIRQPRDKGFKDSVEVETVSLDEMFAGKGQAINVIKMDIEGAEPRAFRGMERIIVENPDLKVFMEFYPSVIREGGDSPEGFAHRLFEDFGFSIRVIDDYGKGREPRTMKNARELMQFVENRAVVNLFLTRPTREQSVNQTAVDSIG